MLTQSHMNNGTSDTIADNSAPTEIKSNAEPETQPQTITSPQPAADDKKVNAVALNTIPPEERKPLLMEGKKTLFQRVLTRPGARLYAALPPPNDPNTTTVDAIPKEVQSKEILPFNIFYVYDRKTVDAQNWVEIASLSKGPTEGWIDAKFLIDWKQAITVAFTNPGNRERTLLFREHDYLNQLIGAEDRLSKATALRWVVFNEDIPENFPIVSIEPATHIDIQKQFYLLPILETEEVYTHDGLPVRLLKIASVSSDEDVEKFFTKQPSKQEPTPQAQHKDPLLAQYKAGLVFVVDSTISMGPYIDRAREAIRQIYRSIEESNLLGDLSFGLVAYRSYMKDLPDLQYVTKAFAELKDGQEAKTLLDKINLVSPASISTHRFDEDAFAGLLTAIEDMDWKSYDGRYIVLITDAGALRSDDPLSQTKMNASQIRQLALDKGIAIFTFHVLGQSGLDNHESAAAQYRQLTDYPSVGSLYYPVKDGSVRDFGEMTDVLAQALLKQVTEAKKGKQSSAQAKENNEFKTDMEQKIPEGSNDGQLSDLAVKTSLVGNAMQMAYLGRKKGDKAPTIFEAWVPDRDLVSPTSPTLNVHVLLSKNQLSDLQDTLKTIVANGKQAISSSSDFFDLLRNASAIVSRDPNQPMKLADMGHLDEYLSGLPYKSKVLSIDKELWTSWSVAEQQAFVNEIEAKIQLYVKYHDDVDRWITIGGGESSGDAIYPVPLDALP